MSPFAAILLKSPAGPSRVTPQALRALADTFGASQARPYEALDGTEAYTYLDLKGQALPPADFTRAVEAKAAGLFKDTGVIAWALTGINDIEGADEGQAAPFFYTVEIATRRGEDTTATSAWYDEEHMPGLAAVPGCVHARRFITDGDIQTSCACYEIANKDIRETAAWNAVRGTPWSLKVKPLQVSLKRNMFRAMPVVKF